MRMHDAITSLMIEQRLLRGRRADDLTDGADDDRMIAAGMGARDLAEHYRIAIRNREPFKMPPTCIYIPGCGLAGEVTGYMPLRVRQNVD